MAMDLGWLALAVQVAIALGTSLLVARLLGPVLGGLLVEVCGGEVRARFWETFTRLMLVLAPLLQVVLFTDADGGQAAVTLVREAMVHALAGAFIGLAAVGGVVWNIALASARGGAVAGEH